MTGRTAREPSLTVGIIADLPGDSGGGVNQFTEGLVRSLVALPREDLRYVIFLGEDNGGWLSERHKHVSVVHVRRQVFPRGWGRWLDRAIRYGEALSQACRGNLLQARGTIKRRSRQRKILEAVRSSPWELQLVHFPFQDMAPVRVPVIFSPWDLQHLHLRELWRRSEARERDAFYRLGCRRASCLALGSEWAREDVIAQYGVPRSKTTVVRVAPATRLAGDVTPEFCARLRDKYGLPRQFIFYPSVTWTHKNHKGLLSALAKANNSSRRGLHLVCCGASAGNQEEIMAHAEKVGVRDRVRFLGHIEGTEVRGLYRLAEMCVFPSLFEGAGFPVLEAFEEGCPLAASNVTSIPEYAGDAALLFDPRDVDSISDAILALASSESLRRDLVARGKERVRRYSWENVANEYASLYRKLIADHRVVTR